MDKIIIRGGNRLTGALPISGAKNAALTLLPCALLTEEPLTLRNLPRLADIDAFQHLMNQFGVSTTIAGSRPEDFGRVMTLEATRITSSVAPYELVRKMRASILVLGPMLARMGEATVSLPGGCAIGNRPIDLHLKALEALGAHIELAAGYVRASAPDGGLPGGRYSFPIVSVGATENALMAAATARDKSTFHNAAREPEIVDVADCLNKMGARVSGAGTSRIVIDGVPKLGGARHSVVPDRIETGTYAMAVAMTGGDVMLEGARPELLQAGLDVLAAADVSVTSTNHGIRVARNGAGIRPVDVTTAPFPGFPTDLQAQLMALMTRANGTSRITETIFENRFMHVQELVRLGARIHLDGETATVQGVEGLKGAPVMATDLRASVSLVIAALAADGETMVNRVYHLDRGFERLEDKLARCGAAIERVTS